MCIVMVCGVIVSTSLYTCAVLPMCRVSCTYSERGSSHSISSLVVEYGRCERSDCERGSMATQCELP